MQAADATQCKVEEVPVETGDGNCHPVSRLVYPDGKVLVVGREIWREFLPAMAWSPIQRQLKQFEAARLADAEELWRLRRIRAVGPMVSCVTLIPPEAVHSVLKGRPGLETIAEQLANVGPIAAGASPRWFSKP